MRKRSFLLLLALVLICQSCGKSEKHLRCEKAFKEYYGEHLAAAFVAAVFGAADPSALNITSLEVSEYKVLNELKVADSLNIIREKAEERFQKSLALAQESMEFFKKKYDDTIDGYYKSRKEAEDYMERHKDTGHRSGYDYVLYASILDGPKKTVEELQQIYLEDPYSNYSRYVKEKKRIDDMVAQKEEIIDKWFEDSPRYKSMDANKVLGKCVEVTFYVNDNKSTEQKMLLIFNENLSKVLGEME